MKTWLDLYTVELDGSLCKEICCCQFFCYLSSWHIAQRQTLNIGNVHCPELLSDISALSLSALFIYFYFILLLIRLIVVMASCLTLISGEIPLTAFPKDTTSELAGLFSILMLDAKLGLTRLGNQTQVYCIRGRRSIHLATWLANVCQFKSKQFCDNFRILVLSFLALEHKTAALVDSWATVDLNFSLKHGKNTNTTSVTLCLFNKKRTQYFPKVLLQKILIFQK